MRIFFIVDEFPFFLPEYLDSVVLGLEGEHAIAGITPLVTPKNHKTLYTYIKAQIFHLGILNIIKLSFEAGKLQVGKILFALSITKNPKTILQVAKKHRIKIINTVNVNDKNYLEKLRKLKVDIIVSSCSQIFKKDILAIPKISCINRHSAFLPSYGGLFPVFYAMINNEKYIGVTVHRMVQQIDGGSILSQIKIPVRKNDSLFSLYRKSYEQSVNATLEAIKKLKLNNSYFVKPIVEASYFSFPEEKHWKIFWKKNEKII